MFFIISILACWRLTYMLREEDGPFHIFTKIRDIIINMEDDQPRNPESFGAQLFACFYCLSIWVAVPFAVFLSETLWQIPLYILSTSAGAILINELKH